MISFKTFLTEKHMVAASSDASVYAPKPMKINDFLEWCDANASQYLKNRGSHGTIYRGTQSTTHPIGLIDSDNFNRVSANTSNIYTLWIDNHKAWKEYPKRSKGLICSQSAEIAKTYGNVCVIIPADKNKIGICPDDDIWTSITFEDIYLNQIAEEIYFLIMNIYGGDAAKKSETDFDTLKLYLKEIDVDEIRKIVATLSASAKANIMQFIKFMRWPGHDNLYELLEYVITPHANGFKTMKASSYTQNKVGSKEIWIQGECAVLDFNKMDDLSVFYKDYGKLKSFFSKYKFMEFKT